MDTLFYVLGMIAVVIMFLLIGFWVYEVQQGNNEE